LGSLVALYTPGGASPTRTSALRRWVGRPFWRGSRWSCAKP